MPHHSNGGTSGPGTHTISAVVEDRAGVLARVAGLFARRGYNISSLSVNSTHKEGVSRMTLRVKADSSAVLEQIVKQLYKLVDVLKVYDHVNDDVVERELAIIKVSCTASNRPEIMQICTVFRATIVDVCETAVIVEVTGRGEKIDALLRLLSPFGVAETARTGCVILARGSAET
ncbi:MAG: acetolactate synthase small subunit [Armatimonadia bacterium]|nr:acetolactate synthase small subunit [Armatimonadia bacterium]